MNSLRVLKLKFCVRADKEYVSRNFIGNKLRGALGRAMVKLYCIHKELTCDTCSNLNSCIYRKVFKPLPLSGEFTTQPAPFVLEVSGMNQTRIKKGRELSFCITVFGDRIRYWEEILLSAVAVFERDKESFNRSFSITEISSAIENKSIWRRGELISEPLAALWSDSYENTRDMNKEEEIRLMVDFKSALLTKESHEYLSFQDFIDFLFYRAASIIDLYEDEEFIIPYRLLNRKPYVTTEYLRKGDKNKLIFTGRIAGYLPYIDIGSYLHLGKKSTYGFGEYTYEIIN